MEQWYRRVLPHYRFDPEQVATLVGFLESKTEADFVANVHLEPATAAQIEHGNKLVIENGCASCHSINMGRKCNVQLVPRPTFG